jgi:hypothetical protein
MVHRALFKNKKQVYSSEEEKIKAVGGFLYT